MLEAFEHVQRSHKMSDIKILGRSRKERELDKHFNHQTKEIKNNKEVRRHLKRARKGTRYQRMHLPGDKERVARPRRRTRRRRVGPSSRVPVDIVQGLQRLSSFIVHREKFPKAMTLLHRWVKEYMNQDNREYLFEVLHGAVLTGFLAEVPDSRQEVMQTFEYVLAYFASWFAENEAHVALGHHWRIASVHSCRCFTDDAFTLTSVIARLTETLCLLRENEAVLREADAQREEPKKELDVKTDVKAVKMALAVKSALDVKVKSDDAKSIKIEVPLPGKSPIPQDPIDIADDSSSISTISSDESCGSGGAIDLEDSPSVKDEEDKSDSSSEQSDDEGEGQIIEDIFPVPPVGSSLVHVRAQFVDSCLATLFSNRGPPWARQKIDNFFQDVYYKRDIFTSEQQERVTAWQARIKVLQKQKEKVVGEANNPLESKRPVIDSREDRVSFDADTNSWAQKQTFDSRDTYGGSKTLR